MAQGKMQLKFERNPWNNFRDNPCHRRTDDGRRTKVPYYKLCWQSQVELKKWTLGHYGHHGRCVFHAFVNFELKFSGNQPMTIISIVSSTRHNQQERVRVINYVAYSMLISQVTVWFNSKIYRYKHDWSNIY